MASRKFFHRDPARMFILVPSDEYLAQAAPAGPLGPLAGPEDYPEPTLGPLPIYHPREAESAGNRGYFLDRYIY